MPKPPLSLRPETVDKWFLRDPLKDGEIIPDAVLSGLKKALQAAHEGAERIAALADTSDPALTAEGNALRLRDAALKAAERSAGALDKARDQVRSEIARIEAETAAPSPPKDALSLQLEAEIRQRLVGMKDEDRRKTVNEAIKSGDDTVVGAFLRGPVFLTGAGDAEREKTRHQWRSEHFPSEVDRVNRLHKALEAVERGGKALMTFTAEIAQSPSVSLAEAAKQRADEAAAALTE